MHVSAVFICLWPLYHWFMLVLTKCWLSLTSQTLSIPQCQLLPIFVSKMWLALWDRKGLTCESHKLARYHQSLNNVWIGPEGTEWTMHSKNIWRQNQKSFSSVAVQALCELIHEIQALRLLGICINKNHPSCWDKWMDNVAIWKAWAKPSQWNHELAGKYLLYEC